MRHINNVLHDAQTLKSSLESTGEKKLADLCRDLAEHVQHLIHENEALKGKIKNLEYEVRSLG